MDSAGVVGLTYYRLRKPTSNHMPTDYWFRASHDGGKTFGRERHIAGPFDLQTAPRMKQGYFLGDYEGLAAAGRSFVVLFAANSGNTHNPTDVFLATIRP